MGRRSYAAVPNRLIEDCSLKHTTKRIAVALLMENRRRNGCIRISLEDLAKRSGCGVSTVQKGLRELTAHGYVRQERSYYYSKALGRDTGRTPTAWNTSPAAIRWCHALPCAVVGREGAPIPASLCCCICTAVPVVPAEHTLPCATWPTSCVGAALPRRLYAGRWPCWSRN